MFMRISYHQADALKPGNFLWRTLRITAGHNNVSFWIGTSYAAYGCPGILVGRRRHGACIEDNELGVLRRSAARKSAVEQLTLNRSAIRLGRATAEVLDMETGHGVIIRSNGRLPFRTGSRIFGLAVGTLMAKHLWTELLHLYRKRTVVQSVPWS